MIQLDSTAEKKFAIKLDDYDGTSNPELVQNGDFSQVGANVIQNHSFEGIGSQLVSNGDFSQEGDELITNGDFSATGSELVTNGDFSAVGSELIDNWNFSNGTNDWSADNDSTISVGTHYGRSDVADIEITGTDTNDRISQSFTFTEGKLYKVVVDVYLPTGFDTFRFDTSDSWVLGNFVETNIASGWTTLTGYIVALQSGAQDVWLRSMLDGASGQLSHFYVDSVSIKELEDWTVYTDDDGGVEFNSQGVKITNGALDGQAKIFQSSVFESGKSYKFTYTIVEYNGGDIGLTGQSAAMSRDVGTHVEYIVGGATSDFILGKANTNTDVTVTDISLQELGIDWTVENTDATHYVEFIETGARFVSGALTPILTLRQDVVSIGKFYKITCDATYAVGSGVARFQIGSINTSSIQEGSNTIYLQSATTSDNSYVLRDEEDIDVVLTNISIKEVGQDWVLNSNWSIGGGGAIADGTSDGTLWQTGVVEDNKSYKVTYTISDFTQGSISVDLSGTNGATRTTSGTYTDYILSGTSPTTRFSFEGSGSFIGTISNISVKQLDPDGDWTLGTGASFGSGNLVIDGGDGNVATQPSIPNVTKAYELTFTVANYVQGNIYGIVSDTKGANITSNGTHYQYLKGTSGTVTGLGCSSSFIGDVTSIFVKQIDPDDDWILTNGGGEIFITTDPADPKGNYVSSLIGSSFKQTKFLIEKNTEYTAEFEIPSMSSGILAWYTSDGVTLLSDNYVSAASKYTFNFEGNDTYGFMIQAVKITGTTATIKNVSVKRRYAGEVTLRFINQLTEKETVVNLTPDSHDDRCAIFTYQATDFIEGMYLIRFSGGGGTYAESLAYISKGSTPLSESEYKEYTTGDDSPDHVYIPR